MSNVSVHLTGQMSLEVKFSIITTKSGKKNAFNHSNSYSYCKIFISHYYMSGTVLLIFYIFKDELNEFPITQCLAVSWRR